MSKTGKRLGRGLSTLVGGAAPTIVPEPGNDIAHSMPTAAPSANITPRAIPDSATKPAVETRSLPVELLGPNPFQPRSAILDKDIASLSDSIRRNGILQPITVRPHGSRFQIIAGERRFAAARQAGLAQVPVVVRHATDEEMVELALIENIQREDLNPIDRARAYRDFCNRFHLRPDDVAARLGEDRSTVSNYLRLLDLDADLQVLVARGALSMGHARSLLGIAEASRRAELARAIVANELSVRALEEIVRRERAHPEGLPSGPGKAAKSRPRHLDSLERQFEQALKTKVRIQEGKRKGSGRILIEFYSLDDFDRVAERLGIEPDRV